MMTAYDTMKNDLRMKAWEERKAQAKKWDFEFDKLADDQARQFCQGFTGTINEDNVSMMKDLFTKCYEIGKKVERMRHDDE